MPRRVEHFERDVSGMERLTMGRFLEWKAKGRPGTGDHAGSGGRELARPRHEVGVNVRLDRKRDRQAMSRCNRGIRVYIPPRVDDDGRARAPAGDEIRRLRQAFVGKPFKHEVRSASGS